MLTQEEYRRMESELRASGRSCRSVARRFGVAVATARKIRNRVGRVRFASESPVAEPTGEYRRCPECGALAKLPCAFCALKRALKERTLKESGANESASGAAFAVRAESPKVAELRRRAESFRFVPLFAAPSVVSSVVSNAVPNAVPNAARRVEDDEDEPDFSLDLPPAAYARYLEVRRWRERWENPRFDVLPDDWPWRNENRRKVGRYKRRKRDPFPRERTASPAARRTSNETTNRSERSDRSKQTI